MARTPTTTPAPAGTDAALLAKYKDFPGIKVLERRMDAPDLPGTLPIRLTDEPAYVQDPHGKKRRWYVRWINCVDGRYSQVTDAMGYVPVRVEELQNRESVIGLSDAKDGIVRRGDRGQEVLVKMPLEVYTRIKARQQELRTKRSRNAKAVREDLANIAGAQLGSHAGDMVHDEFSVEVKRGRRTTIGAELGDED
jgi:hypothetical protein